MISAETDSYSRFSPPYGFLNSRRSSVLSDLSLPLQSVHSDTGREEPDGSFLTEDVWRLQLRLYHVCMMNISNVFQLERERKKPDWFYVWPPVWVYVLFPIRNNILKGCNVDILSYLFLPLKSSPLIIFFNSHK